MSFVQVGGDAASKPTFFEVIASDRLVPSFKAAVIYALSVLSQRHSWLHRVLSWEEEVLALILGAADAHSLLTTDATLAEGLYGLRRKVLPTTNKQYVGKQAGNEQHTEAFNSEHLAPKQRYISLLLQVLVPYVRSRSLALYHQLRSGPLGLALATAAARQGSGFRERVLHTLCRWFISAYPSVSAGWDLCVLAYQSAYLLGLSPCHHPLLHLQGLTLSRMTSQDMAAMNQHRDSRRNQVLRSVHEQRLKGHVTMAAVKEWSHKLGWLVTDNARYALILAVFGFKALEWWFTSGEERLGAGKAVAPPAPPPPVLPSPAGCGLPVDPRCCPVCRRPVTGSGILSLLSSWISPVPIVANSKQRHDSARSPGTDVPNAAGDFQTTKLRKGDKRGMAAGQQVQNPAVATRQDSGMSRPSSQCSLDSGMTFSYSSTQASGHSSPCGSDLRHGNLGSPWGHPQQRQKQKHTELGSTNPESHFDPSHSYDAASHNDDQDEVQHASSGVSRVVVADTTNSAPTCSNATGGPQSNRPKLYVETENEHVAVKPQPGSPRTQQEHLDIMSNSVTALTQRVSTFQTNLEQLKALSRRNHSCLSDVGQQVAQAQQVIDNMADAVSRAPKLAAKMSLDLQRRRSICLQRRTSICLHGCNTTDQ